MKLIQSKDANINYLAKVVNITEFITHPNPVVTQMKCCTIDGYSITTGINASTGIYIYFPTDCTINSDFLSFANQYKHKELNADVTKAGFFEDNGRVKSIRLQKVISEGFIIPEEVFSAWILSRTNTEIQLIPGTEFDTVEHNGKSFWITKKYIVTKSLTPGMPGSRNKEGKKPKGFDKLIDGQFRFHYDTVILKKCPYAIHPDDIIDISEKVHGTSGISAIVLCKKKTTLWQKIVSLFTGKKYVDYDNLYSSRSVIKNRYYNKQVTSGFYGVDVWKYANDVVSPYLEKGMTAYYEIVGFLPSGGYIQKGYDYGYVPPVENGSYLYGVHFGVKIYRITTTSENGEVTEWDPIRVREYCSQINDLDTVQAYYTGFAKDLYPELNTAEHWNENFLQKLSDDEKFFMELDSPTCRNKVPHEGIVIKNIDKVGAFKLKCFRFIDKEGRSLDEGTVDIESES